MVAFRSSLIAALVVPLALAAQENQTPEMLYIQKGCLGCHGGSAGGARRGMDRAARDGQGLRS